MSFPCLLPFALCLQISWRLLRLLQSDAREALGFYQIIVFQQIVSLQLQSNLLLAQSSALVLFAIEMRCLWAAGKGMGSKDADFGGRMQVGLPAAGGQGMALLSQSSRTSTWLEL